ncbi:MAG: hypothetical protein DRI37_09925 [Chloroflexi bacterium]|nr:MAG: hypothetical protein DRI37_09925 [Chloroflexota bacterium]
MTEDYLFIRELDDEESYKVESRVLFIEDNAINRQRLRECFEAHGMQVEEAEDGRTGLSLATRLLPQAIVISTTLPDMAWTEVAQQLRAVTRTQHIYLMLLADKNIHKERLSGLEWADDFVASPFDPEEVGLRIRNALRRANSANFTDPTTGLPASHLIQEQLRHLLQSPAGDWALLRLHVAGLGSFREQYGLQAADDFLRGVARILAESLANDTVQDDFLGYSGHDDFIIITHRDRAPGLEAEVLEAFKKMLSAHYASQECKQGFIVLDGKHVPLAALRSHCTTSADGPFYDIRSLSEALVS